MKKRGQRTFNNENVHRIKMLGLTLYPLYSPCNLACVARRFCRAGRTSGEAAGREIYSAPNQNRHATQATGNLAPRPQYYARPMHFGSRGPFVSETSPKNALTERAWKDVQGLGKSHSILLEKTLQYVF